MRFVQFITGVVLIVGPSALLVWSICWSVLWTRYPQLWRTIGTSESGFEQWHFGTISNLALLTIAAAGWFLGSWLIRRSRGDDDRPHPLSLN
jgi:hypothetical protein